jgi:hypothetical protein
MSLSTQVCWREPWSEVAEAHLRQALAVLGRAVQELPSQEWDRTSLRIAGFRDTELSYVSAAGESWSSIVLHLHALFGEELSRELSKLQPGAVLAVREFEQSCWGYLLVQGGRVLDRFWSQPDVVDEDPGECRGDARRLADAMGVAEQVIARYLVATEAGGRAYPDDDFPLEDPWVRTDFMRRLGIQHVGEAPSGRYLLVVDPGLTAARPPPSSRRTWRTTRDWWRFW